MVGKFRIFYRSFWPAHHFHSNSKHLVKTFYEILKVDQNSTGREIKAAYIKLSKELHPDKNPRNPESHIKFVLVNQAYNVLKDPAQRTIYDQHLATGILDGIGKKSWNQTNYNEESYQRQWRDESLWSMRDRSKDKYYEGKPYYGIKGIKRIQNKFIALGCFILMCVGMIGHYFAISYGRGRTIDQMNQEDLKNSEIYMEVRRQAQELGTEAQLEILKRSQKGKESDD